MRFTLTNNSTSYLEIERIYKTFELIPNNIKYEKKYPNMEGAFRKVITIRFRWLFWKGELLIRKR